MGEHRKILMNQMNQRIELFFSYAHEDEKLRDELAKQLKLLERQGIISAWHDRQIVAGSEWGSAIDTHLDSAQVILLLVSPDFLASDYCWDIEVKRAMERHEAGEACVIPIVLRPVDYWQEASFGKLQALPTNAKPVTTWENCDEAFMIVAQGIRKAIEQLTATSPDIKLGSEVLFDRTDTTGIRGRSDMEIERNRQTDLLKNNSQRSYSELQKEYDFLTENIQFLRQSERTDDHRISLRERFRLKKQMEEAKEEREQIGQQLKQKELENTSIATSENLYRTLLRLGYRQQIRLFRRLIQAESVAAFLIHGLPDYGQQWLLNRLVVQYVPSLLNGKVIKINVSRKVRRNDVSALWREVAGRLGLKGKQYMPSEIAKQVCQCLQTQNVLLVFHEVETMPENTLSDLIHDFWLPLVSKVQELPCQASKFKLLMFLIDYEGCVGSWEVPFVEQLNANWEPQTPIKSPMISEFSDDDLSDWIDTEYDLLPVGLTARVDETVQEILENSKNDNKNGIPELVLEEICDRCGCDWYEESEKWLKL